MYMGVILAVLVDIDIAASAPHVYGGDPTGDQWYDYLVQCSPCIWG